MDYYLHESSYVDEGATIGDGTRVWHFSHIMSTARIGSNCTLGQNVFVGNNVIIGNNVKIQNNVSLYDGVVLEDDVFLGPSVVLTNVVNPRSFIERKDEFALTRLSKGCTIGANATILCGHTIGPYAFVAAGATVTKDIPAYALVKGIPARFSHWVCQCANPLASDETNDLFSCPSCSRRYTIDKVGQLILNNPKV